MAKTHKARIRKMNKTLIAVLSVVLAFSLVLCATQFYAWFRNFLTEENEADISNFLTQVQYSFNETDWSTYSSEQPITVTAENLENLQVKVQYQGQSAAYLRMTVYGNFYNKNTGTVLPIPDSFWSLVPASESDSNWVISDDGYGYYKQRLEQPPHGIDLETFGVRAALPEDRSLYQEYEGKLYIIVDAVQPDRYPAFWGISELPFS